MDRNLFLSVREPLGVWVAYIAWNFPMGNLSMKLGAVMASGCTAVIKPATRTPLSTLYLARSCNGSASRRGDQLCGGQRARGEHGADAKHDPGHADADRFLQRRRELVRDSATSIKRFSLELGGNAPVIVTRNADVAAAARASMGGKMFNAGQICVSPQRVFVERAVHDEFVAAARTIAAGAKCGSVYDEGCKPTR
jgi:succinate-semialdehyde dehydrogenase/glutarate-semialdehyde dehydrogenase